jgi:hypothetical protein
MRILAIGNGAKELALQLWPEAIVDTKAAKNFRYDQVISVNELQKNPYRKTANILKDLFGMTNGELHVFVPSLEWAAEQILSPTPSPVTLLQLFGEDGINKCGFSVNDLRAKFDEAGIPVSQARIGEQVMVAGEENYITQVIYMVGYRPK